MKFYSDRIVTRPISLEEAAAAAKAKGAQKVPSLDQVLANIDTQNKTVKTAASEAPAKVAEVAKEAPKAEAPKVVEAAKVEAPKAEAPKVVEAKADAPKVVEAAKEAPKTVEANAGNFGDKKAPPFGKKDEKDEKGEKGDKEEDKKHDKSCDCKACMASTAKPAKQAASKVQLKVAKALDFRGWDANGVVKAWGEHGTIEACCKNVDGKVSDAKTYCGLLQVAASEAGRIIKEAAAKKEPKQASSEKQHKNARFKLIAKMTDDEISRMKAYWTELYGEEYAKSMLEDY